MLATLLAFSATVTIPACQAEAVLRLSFVGHHQTIQDVKLRPYGHFQNSGNRNLNHDQDDEWPYNHSPESAEAMDNLGLDQLREERRLNFGREAAMKLK